MRLYALYTFVSSTDQFHSSLFINLWSAIELSVGISCASLTGIRPALRCVTRSQYSRTRTKTRVPSKDRRRGRQYGRCLPKFTLPTCRNQDKPRDLEQPGKTAPILPLGRDRTVGEDLPSLPSTLPRSNYSTSTECTTLNGSQELSAISVTGNRLKKPLPLLLQRHIGFSGTLRTDDSQGSPFHHRHNSSRTTDDSRPGATIQPSGSLETRGSGPWPGHGGDADESLEIRQEEQGVVVTREVVIEHTSQASASPVDLGGQWPGDSNVTSNWV